MATFGGIVTQLVTKLLEDKIYDSVFVVGSYCHKKVTCAEKFSNVEDLKNIPKSCYVMVSHENTLKYMRMNKENKIIIVATPCVGHGLINVIDLLKLNRDNYLLIGLFCDKTMTNEVFDYFEYVFGCGNKKLDKIHFRTKEVGGWPGGVRLFWKNGSCTDLPNRERTQVKEYFQPEGCLYCLDKVNYLADISVGDNYIEESSNNKGTSSVILRSMIAMHIWARYKQYFISNNETEKNIFFSQGLERRKDNATYVKYKGIHYILPDNIMPEEKNQYMVKKNYKKLIKNLARGKNRNYQYIYKKSRHNYKKLLVMYYGVLGKIKEFFGFL